MSVMECWRITKLRSKRLLILRPRSSVDGSYRMLNGPGGFDFKRTAAFGRFSYTAGIFGASLG